MANNKYGFVYLWYDRKHHRFYIGSHWGREDDGYICSSKWMLNAYKIRPQDFKYRRILSRVYTTKKDLLDEEYRFLCRIKKEELKVRYYNLHNHHFNHWSASSRDALSIKEKISQTLKKRGLTEEEKDKLAEARRNGKTRKGCKLSEEQKEALKPYQFKKGQVAPNKGKHLWKNRPHPQLGKQLSEERKEHLRSICGEGMIWITNGIESIRIQKDDPIPEGFKRGNHINIGKSPPNKGTGMSKEELHQHKLENQKRYRQKKKLEKGNHPRVYPRMSQEERQQRHNEANRRYREKQKLL